MPEIAEIPGRGIFFFKKVLAVISSLKVILLAAAVVALFAAGITTLTFTEFYSSIKPEKTVSDVVPSEYGLEYENPALQTEDGISLDAWFVPSGEKTNRTIVVLHGYLFDKNPVFPMADFLHEGFNILLPDFRCMGRSGGSYTSRGFHEKKDVAAAVKYLRKRNQTAIGLFEFSMGGAVAIMAAKNKGIDPVAADSNFAGLNDREKL